MNIVFFGNADFGIPTLDSIVSSKEHSLVSVVTNIDKKSGRGKYINSTPIKRWGIDNEVDVLGVDNLDSHEFIESLKKIEADLFVVIAYRILPDKIFSIPKYGTMNLHASLLPKYRGAAPIQRAILNGESLTGTTTFIINDKVDKGKIILQEQSSISENDNYSSLYTKLSKSGSNLVLRSIEFLNSGKALKEQQEKTIYAKKIHKSELKINWDQDAFNIINKIRAFSFTPGAYTTLSNKRVKILEAEVSDVSLDSLEYGTLRILNNELYVKTRNSTIKINLLKPEGKQVLRANDFINGYLSTNENILRFE